MDFLKKSALIILGGLFCMLVGAVILYAAIFDKGDIKFDSWVLFPIGLAFIFYGILVLFLLVLKHQNYDITLDTSVNRFGKRVFIAIMMSLFLFVTWGILLTDGSSGGRDTFILFLFGVVLLVGLFFLLRDLYRENPWTNT